MLVVGTSIFFKVPYFDFEFTLHSLNSQNYSYICLTINYYIPNTHIDCNSHILVIGKYTKVMTFNLL